MRSGKPNRNQIEKKILGPIQNQLNIKKWNWKTITAKVNPGEQLLTPFFIFKRVSWKTNKKREKTEWKKRRRRRMACHSYTGAPTCTCMIF
jgi:hypothetical protein